MINPNLSNRTPLLTLLRKAFRFSSKSSEPTSPPADELIEFTAAKSIKRRKFISDIAKAGIATGAAGFIASCKKTADMFPVKNNQPNIVIIGAGMAGLNCAYQLKKAGYESKIYEGSSRTGGRIFTQKNLIAPGVNTELGGEFVDSVHRDMISLCTEFGLLLLDLQSPSEGDMQKDSYYFNNQFYSINEVIDAFKPYAAQIQADINSLPDVISFDNYGNTKKFDLMSISEYFDSIGLHGWIREALEVAYLTEYGLEAGNQSSINFLYLFSPDTSNGTFDIFGISDERYRIDGGNQQIINALAEQAAANIHHENILVKIEEQARGNYILYFQKKNGGISALKADIVVLAIPFTTLRNVEIDVSMPKWKTNAINHLGYGTNAKLFLGFHERTWRDYKYSGYLFSDGAIQNGWDHSLQQESPHGGYTIFQGGKAALALGEGTPESQAPKFINQLDTCWLGCKSSYNGKVKRMQWPEYPFTLGSYACYKPGQWTSIAGAEHRTIGNLFFAGEHCSFAFQGYMNGAAQTGRRAAENILKRIQ